MVLVCGMMPSGRLPKTLCRPPLVGSSDDATSESAMSSHDIALRVLSRALDDERRAPVVEHGRIGEPGEATEHDVALVPGAADRVVAVTLGAELVRGQIEVAREHHRLEQLESELGLERPRLLPSLRPVRHAFAEAQRDFAQALERHRGRA